MICCGIYAITNKTNDKKYIGMSNHILKRWGDHIQSANEPNNDLYNSPLYRAFRKYGIESFSFEILELCNQAQLVEKEIYWIDYYDSYNKGYNSTVGGEGFSTVDYQPIIDMWNDGKSMKEIGQTLHFDFKTIHKAITQTETYSIKEAKRRGNGKKIDMYRTNGEYVQTFTSIAEAAEAVNCDRSCITRAAQCYRGNSIVKGYIFQYHGNTPPLIKYGRRRRINQYDLDGKYIATYNSIADAARELNISMRGIASCFHKSSKSSGGYMFRYYEDGNTDNIEPYNAILRSRGKAVSNFSPDHTLLKTYKNASQASRETGIKSGNISACCRGEQHSAGGYIWEIANQPA